MSYRKFLSMAIAILWLLPFQADLVNADEFRGLWADAWHAGFKNAAEVTALVNTADTYNFNAILPQIRLRGDAYYFPTYPNIEPRSSKISSTFDPLADMINKAHAKGIEVHAWVTTYPVLSLTANSHPNHVSNLHPEWLTQDYSGSTSFGEGKYLDPGVPDANTWNYNVCMDLVQHYDIDGIHLDYIRYPNQNSGYNPIAIERFNREYGRVGKPGTSDSAFSAWRRKQVTQFVTKLYVNAIAVKPQMKLSVATFSSRSDAYSYRFQDWASWMQDGIVDANCPMNYSSNNSTFNSRCDDALSRRYGRHLYMGVYVHGSTLTQLLYARGKGCEGSVIYSYYLGNTTFFNNLKNQVFTTSAAIPSMSWKTNPTQGSVKGIVSSFGAPVDNGRVVLKEAGKGTRTDGTGCYAFTEIPPGTYTIEASAESCENQSKSVNVQAGEVSTIDFDLLAGKSPTPTSTPTPWPTDKTYENIVDNTSVFYSDTGWSTGTSAIDRYGIDYRWATTTYSGKYANFQPNLLFSGNYKVYVWYCQGGNRSPNTPHTIYYSGGSQTFHINQQTNGGKWNYLGEFPFQSGNSGYIRIGNNALETVVIADAVKFEHIAPPTPTPSPTPARAEGTFIQLR